MEGNSGTRYAIDSNTRKYVRSDVLASGVARSIEFECPCCSKSLGFVAHKLTPHFRHKAGESCIIDKNNIEKIHRECENIIKNQMSNFHKNWQSIFPQENQEIRITRRGITHISDIMIETSTEEQSINFVDDSDNYLLKVGTGKLFIEIQHSPLSKDQVEKRETFYRRNKIENENNSRMKTFHDLLWIIDISETEFMQSNIETLDMKYTKFAFPTKHSIALANLFEYYSTRNTYSRPNVLLDTGLTDLYFLEDFPRLNTEFVMTNCLSKKEFFTQLKKYVSLHSDKLNLVSKNSVEGQSAYIYSNNYCFAINNIRSLSYDRRLIINDLCNLLEIIPLPMLRTFHSKLSVHEDNYVYYSTCINMLIAWMGIISSHDRNMLGCLYNWLKHIKDTSTCYKVPVFKKNVPLNSVSESYFATRNLSQKWYSGDMIKLIHELQDMQYSKLKSTFYNSNLFVHFEAMMMFYENNYTSLNHDFPPKKFKWKNYTILENEKHLIVESRLCVPSTFEREMRCWNISYKQYKLLLRSKWICDNVYGDTLWNSVSRVNKYFNDLEAREISKIKKGKLKCMSRADIDTYVDKRIEMIEKEAYEADKADKAHEEMLEKEETDRKRLTGF